jgi:hypothetical protein
MFSALLGLNSQYADAQATAPRRAPVTESIDIDIRVPAQDFPHFWEKTFGSGAGDPDASRKLSQ